MRFMQRTKCELLINGKKKIVLVIEYGLLLFDNDSSGRRFFKYVNIGHF